MIYKFSTEDVDLEIELMQRKDVEEVLREAINIAITQGCDGACISIDLSKKNVYHLIGALHLLHKEMK